MTNFHKEFDKYLNKHDIKGAKEYINNSLENAILKKDNNLIITILNEAIGFYRDLSLFDESRSLADSLNKIIENSDEVTRFISLINIGNSYRAYGDLDSAITIFNKAIDIYNAKSLELKNEYAACLNNLALTYQDSSNHKEAINYFLKAKAIVLDEIKLATTNVNIASSFFALKDYDNTKKYLSDASLIFENDTLDFHFMGYAHTNAKYYSIIKDYDKAIKYYEKALSSILMNVKRSKLYYDVREEYLSLLDKLNMPQRISGIELSEEYYNKYKNIFFNTIKKELHNKISIGLFGLGSECYYADDLISEDHDFDQGFIVLVNDDVTENDFNTIKESYNSLPLRYKRYYRENLNKKGVHYFSNYLKEFLGYNESYLSEETKALITNGKVFYNGLLAPLSELRRKILKEERYLYFEHLIRKTLEINQYIPYNINRAIERNDNDTASILKNHLIDKLIEYYYIYYNKFIPHDKLRLKLMNDGFIKNQIVFLLKNDINMDFCNNLSNVLLKNLFELNVIKKLETLYIEDYREELLSFVDNYSLKRTLVNKIVELEWSLFTTTENIGGKASCQFNKPYFTLMREAQYYTWDNAQLESYLNDIVSTSNNGYNIITLKYSYMEKNTDPNHFKEIENIIPKIESKKEMLVDSILELQLEMMEEYNALNKDKTSLMRTISSEFDTLNNTSYETYLKGELLTYSDNTLVLYSKNLIELAKNNKNIVELTVSYTNLFHLDEYVE